MDETELKTEIKHIPRLRFREFNSEWQQKPIGSLLKIASGKDHKGLEDGNIPVFGTGGYMRSVNKALYSGESVLIGRKGTINKPFYYNGEFWTVDTLFYTRDFNAVIPKFVNLLFGRISWMRYNEASGVPSLSKTAIEKIRVNIPTLEEQARISSLFCTLDAWLHNIQSQKKLLEKYKKCVAQKIYSRDLRFKDINGGTFPEWKQKKLGEVGTMSGGGTPSTKNERFWNGTTPWISSSDLEENNIYKINVSKFITDEAIKSSATKKIPKHSVLVISRVGVGKVAVSDIEVCTSQDFQNITPDQKKYSPLFIAYLVSNNIKTLLSYNQGTSIKGFTKNDLCELPFYSPSLDEQIKIAEYLNSLDKEIELSQCLIMSAEAWRNGLMQQMFV